MKDYLADAPFCDFSARSNGSFDWIELKFFNNVEQANAEADLYRTWFGDIIEDNWALESFYAQIEAMNNKCRPIFSHWRLIIRYYRKKEQL